MSAHADYTPKYSGGTVQSTPDPAYHYPMSYSPNSNTGGYGGSGPAQWGSPQGYPASCTGDITVTFNWSGGTPPDAVIIAETCTAQVQCSHSMGSAYTNTCDNGLSSPAVKSTSGSPYYPSDTITSTGSRYTIKQNPGQSFTITCSPNASLSGPNNGGDSGQGTVSVAYGVSTTPVRLDITGLTANSVLIGQGLTASLYTGTYPQSSWQWTVSGDPFAGFQVTQTTGKAIELSPDMMKQATLSWFYRSLNGATGSNPSNISCAATVTFPDGTQQQVTKTETITVYAPTHSFKPYFGTVEILPKPSILNLPPNTLIAWDDPMYGYGFTLEGKVTTPSQFVGEEGNGVWVNEQIVTITESYTLRGAARPTPDPNNGHTGSDGPFYYVNTSWPADGTLNIISDGPSNPIKQNMVQVTIAHVFQTFMLYKPPSADGGSPTTWVPLHEVDWKVNGVANYFDFSQSWVLGTGAGVTSTKDIDVSVLPTWTEVIKAVAY